MAEDKDNKGSSAGMKVDTALVRELAEMLNETGLTEIEVEDGDRKIRVSRGVAAAAFEFTPQQPASLGPLAVTGETAATLAEPAPANEPEPIRSPMVGTVYLSPEPGADPFVRKGHVVNAGDTLLVVEAMKVMNPITAPTAGTVREILVDNAQPVEFDQPLIVVN